MLNMKKIFLYMFPLPLLVSRDKDEGTEGQSLPREMNFSPNYRKCFAILWLYSGF